jgi:hypothetical protein
MENKSDISLTKEVIVSLDLMFRKINNEVKTEEEKIAILEIL